MDDENNLPTALVKKKFIRELNPKISPLVYAANPTTLAAAIDITIQIATGFEMFTKNSKINQLESDEILKLRKQIANLVLVKQIWTDKKKKRDDTLN